MTHKIARASVTIQKELGDIISTVLKDPRLPGFITVTAVNLAPDLSTARVSISTPGSEEESALAVEALQSATGRLGRELQARIKIRRIPKLTFIADDRVARGEDMSEMIDKVMEEDRKLRTRRAND